MARVGFPSPGLRVGDSVLPIGAVRHRWELHQHIFILVKLVMKDCWVFKIPALSNLMLTLESFVLLLFIIVWLKVALMVVNVARIVVKSSFFDDIVGASRYQIILPK